MRLFAVLALCTATVAAPTFAQDREKLGVGRLFTNDYIGDGRDRWRSGSYVFSYVTGPQRYDGTPQAFGQVLEYRLRGEVISPASPTQTDRPFVGSLSVGAHTHFGVGPMQYALGADVVAVGPQTGMAAFQDAFHDLLKLREPATQNEIADDVFISGTAAATYQYQVSETVSLRPFVEATAGVEDLLRIGGDVMIGSVAQDDLMLRDVVTGQLYQGTENGSGGVSYLLGVDVAAVSDSALLSQEDGYVVSDTRTRARAGVIWQPLDGASFFYGVTYLGEEFEGQPEGQVVGSLRLNFNF